MGQSNQENKLVLSYSGSHIQMRVIELTNVFNFRNSKLAKIGFEWLVILLRMSATGAPLWYERLNLGPKSCLC